MSIQAASLLVDIGITGVSEVTRGLNKADTAVKDYGASATAVLGGVVVAAAAAATAALGAFAIAGVRAFGDLEQSVANISTIKPEIDTSGVFASLNEMQTRIPQSAAAIGDSLYNIFSSVSVSQQEALQLTEEFARSAVGAQTSAETFGTAALGVMNAYGLAVDDAAHISDVFFNTVNAGVVTGDELARSLGPVTQSARAAGVSLDELGGFIAGVTKEGGPAEQNINNLNNLFQKITTKDAQSEIEKLGVATATATGQFRPTLDVLTDLKGRLAGMTEAARTNALQAIFPDAQARIGAQVLLNQLDFVKQAIDTNIQSSGSAASAYEKMSQTFNSQATLGKNALMSLATTFGSAVTPALTSFLSDAIIPAINELNHFVQAVTTAADPMAALIAGVNDVLPGFRGAVTVVGVTADIISDNLVPAIYGLSAATTVYAVGSLPKMITGLQRATVALYEMGTAATVALGPLGVLAAGVGLAIAGLVKTHQDGAARILDMTKAVQGEIVTLQEAQKALDALQSSQAGATKGAAANIAELERLKQAHTDVTSKIEEYKFALDQADPEAQARALKPYIDQQHQLENEIAGVTDRMRMQVQAQDYLDKGLKGSTGTWSAYSGGVADVSKALTAVAENTQIVITATAEQLKAAQDALLKVGEEGASALGAVVQANLGFQEQIESSASEHWANLASLHQEWAAATTATERDAIQQRIDAEVSGFAQQEQAAAASYAAQQAANRAHLGALLIDTVNAWQTLGQVPAEMADTMRAGIAEHFGVASDEMSLQFGSMLGVLQGVADGTGVVADDMGQAFGAIEQRATESAATTAATQEQMIANIQAAYNEGKISQQEYIDQLARVPAEVNTLVTSNVPEQVTYWQELGEKQGAISPMTAAQIDSNVVDARERFIDFKMAQAEIKADVPAMVSDNADEVRGRYLILAAKRAALALEKPAVNVTTNADAVTGQLNGVAAAVNNIPATKNVTITATIDPALQRHSPSPIEQVMAAIEEFAARSHTFSIETEGLDKMKSILSIVSDLGGAGASLAKLNSYAGVMRDAVLRFANDMAGVVATLQVIAVNFDKDAVKAAAEWSESAGKIVGIIGNAVDALVNLQDYQGIAPNLLDWFGADLRLLVTKMVDVASQFEVEGVEAAAAFGESVSKIIAPIADGIDAFTKLRDYQGIAPWMLDMLGADLRLVGEKMIDLSSQFEAEGVTAAATFADAAGRIFSSIKTGLDSLAALNDQGNGAAEKANALIDTINGVLVKMADLSTVEGTAAGVTFGDAFTEAMSANEPRMVAVTTDVLKAVHDQAIRPWTAKVNEGMLATGGFWMISLAEGISGNRSAIDAASGMGHDIAAALIAAYGNPVLPAPTIGDPDRKIGPGDKGGNVTTKSIEERYMSLVNDTEKLNTTLTSRFTDIGNNIVTSLLDAVRDKTPEAIAEMAKAADAWMEPFERLSDLGGMFGGLGTSFAKYGLSPVNAALDQVTKEIADFNKNNPGIDYRDTAEGAQLEERRLRALEEQTGLQKQLLALQEEQNKLGFLQQQMKLLDLIKQYGLDPSTILGDIQLGLGASAGGLAEAMARALESVVARMSDDLKAALPTQPEYTTMSMPNLLTMPNLTNQQRSGSTVQTYYTTTIEEGAFTVVAGPGQDVRAIARELTPLVADEIDRRNRLARNR